MLVSLWILIAMRYTIYHWKWFSGHFSIQVQLCKSIQYHDLGFELSKKHTLVLSNTRELNRVPKYKYLPLYKLLMICATLH